MSSSFPILPIAPSINTDRGIHTHGQYICCTKPIYKIRHSAHHGRFVFFSGPRGNTKRLCFVRALFTRVDCLIPFHIKFLSDIRCCRIVLPYCASPHVTTRFTLHPFISRIRIRRLKSSSITMVSMLLNTPHPRHPMIKIAPLLIVPRSLVSRLISIPLPPSIIGFSCSIRANVSSPYHIVSYLPLFRLYQS